MKEKYGCPKCSSHKQVIGPGKGPHKASIRCGICNAFIKWVSQSDADIKANGKVAKKIAYRDWAWNPDGKRKAYTGTGKYTKT